MEKGYSITKFIQQFRQEINSIKHKRKALSNYLIKGSFWDNMEFIMNKYNKHIKKELLLIHKKNFLKLYIKNITNPNYKSIIILTLKGKDRDFITRSLNISPRTYFRYMEQIDKNFKIALKRYTKINSL